MRSLTLRMNGDIANDDYFFKHEKDLETKIIKTLKSRLPAAEIRQ